jgi:hypothetical protein
VEVDAPLRVVASENAVTGVLAPLFRQPGMSGATFEAGAVWVMQDLRALKALFASPKLMPARGRRLPYYLSGPWNGHACRRRVDHPKKPHDKI